MPSAKASVHHFVLLICAVTLFLQSCQSQPEQTLGESCLPLYQSVANSPQDDPGTIDYEALAHLSLPPLRPEETLDHFQLVEGFRIELVAHEPMITDPVAMDIDADGRLWVIDMPTYMPVHDKDEEETVAREQVPMGRVVILEDTDGDGMMDSFRVFADELILPRAIKVLNDGVLVAEPPRLWLIRDTNGDGRGDTREVVSETYGDPVNVTVQSMPSGLIWGMDNWLHSANDGAVSLRRVDGYWQTRPFNRLGQWGMNQDDWGRLYSSSNTWPLEAHLVPYGYSERHPQFSVTSGKNERIAPNQPLWPAHVTGVNRGYRVGVVTREDGTLRMNTAATTPVIYRGGQFGEEYAGNAFTPEPAGNLIKRMIIEGDPGEIDAEGVYAYEGREFLTSTDERFRPVNSYNAPDGSIYVIDMYRGLFEYVRFITDHLMEYTLEHDLHIPTSDYGRIYRIVRDDREVDYDTPKYSTLTPSDTVEYVHHANGALRDQAQQMLVLCSPDGVSSRLEKMALDGSETDQTRLHALWTLEGLARSHSGSDYSENQLIRTALRALEDTHPRIRSSAIRILEPELSANNAEVLDRLYELYQEEPASFVKLQLLASLGESDSDQALHLMATILDDHADNTYFREMALTGTWNRELEFAELLTSEFGWQASDNEQAEELLAALEEAATDQAEEPALDHLTADQQALFAHGQTRYATCMVCHGPEGQGVSGVGPALSGSSWVTGDPDHLTLILLHGFIGGAAERGDNISGAMPSHRFLSDRDLAAIMTYIRNDWGNSGSAVESEDVERLRDAHGDRSTTWAPEELRSLE